GRGRSGGWRDRRGAAAPAAKRQRTPQGTAASGAAARGTAPGPAGAVRAGSLRRAAHGQCRIPRQRSRRAHAGRSQRPRDRAHRRPPSPPPHRRRPAAARPSPRAGAAVRRRPPRARVRAQPHRPCERAAPPARGRPSADFRPGARPPAGAARGAAERSTPVLLTASLTAFALLPVAIQLRQPGHEIEGPMAVVILGGLVSSTLVTLVLIPPLAARWLRPG